MPLTGWPALTDDTGTKTDGTILNKALFDSIKASIEASVFSGSVSAKDIIDEVIAARGSKASLDARLDVALNEDGTPKEVAGAATQTQIVRQLAVNWAYNDDFLIWAGEAANVAPTGYVKAGGGATVARTGTGLGDTVTKVGPFSVKLGRVTNDASLTQNILNSTSFAANGQHLKGRTFGFGAWVRVNTGNVARVRMYDGVGSTSSAYHAGTPSNTWVWLSGVHTISASATQLQVILEVLNSDAEAYFSGVTVLPGSLAPTDWVPCPKVYGTILFKRSGTLATGTIFDRYLMQRPALVKDVQLNILTAPTGSALIVDVNVWDGSAFTTMLTTKPQIAISMQGGAQVPDGTYRYRCLTGSRGVTYTNALLGWDIDQIGSTVAGADLTVSVRAMQYTRPQEDLLDVDDF